MKKRTLIFWGIIIVAIAYITFVFIFPENKRTILFGGTMEIKVEPGQKVMIATFKGNNLFYMTEPMDSGYIPKTKILHEKSGRGIIEFKVKFVERR
jgi:hypothetical protein